MSHRMGEHEVPDEELGELRDSADVADDPAALHERLAEDGYLFIRGFHDPDRVRAARSEIVARLDEAGRLDPDAPREEAVIGESSDGLFISGPSWEEHPELFELVEGEATMSFFGEFVGTKPFTFDYKWGRAKGRGGFTGFHSDIVFMGRGTDDLYTLWTPLGDVPVGMGPLLVLEGSHKNDRLRETYGQMDVDRDVFEATFSDDPYDVREAIGGRLLTADFEAGDALLFTPYTLHGSLSNDTDRYRISVDTRYQSIEEPVDGRWVGREPVTHYNWPSEDETPMADLRAEWGF